MKSLSMCLSLFVTLVLVAPEAFASQAIRQFSKSGKSGKFSYSVYNNRWLRKPEGNVDRISITSVSPDVKGELVIPAELDGMEVYGISDQALASCVGVTAITIPATVQALKPGALNRCPSLTTIKVDDTHTAFASVDGVLFDKKKTTLLALGGGREGNYTVPATTKVIGPGAFSMCTKLTGVIIPEGVTEIGGHRGSVFLGCKNLEGVVLPETVINIGQKSFQDCTSLRQVTIPPKVTEIPFGVFWRCSNLAAVILPDGITKVGNYAFAECPELTLRKLPDGLTNVGSYAFKNCKGLAGLTVPDSVTTISRGAFSGCDVILPKTDK